MSQTFIYSLAERHFAAMAEYGFACHVWFLAGKHDQKTLSADFSLQSVVKYSNIA